MIDTFLGVSALAAVLGLLALLAAGAQLRRCGLGWTAGWAAMVCGGAAWAGHALLSLGTAEVALAGAVVAAVIIAVGRLERDWNPVAHAALATTAACCLAFLLAAVAYLFGTPLHPAAYVVGALLLGLQALT